MQRTSFLAWPRCKNCCRPTCEWITDQLQGNIARIANTVPCRSFLKSHYEHVQIVVLNCQKCNQCLNALHCIAIGNGLKYPGLLFEGELWMSFSLSLSFCWSCHVTSPLWSNVSKVTLLLGCSPNVFVSVFLSLVMPCLLITLTILLKNLVNNWVIF